jgi:hypothetical protein
MYFVGHKKLKECIEEGHLHEGFILGGLDAWTEVCLDAHFFLENNIEDPSVLIKIESLRIINNVHKEVKLRMQNLSLRLTITEVALEKGKFTRGECNSYCFYNKKLIIPQPPLPYENHYKCGFFPESCQFHKPKGETNE